MRVLQRCANLVMFGLVGFPVSAANALTIDVGTANAANWRFTGAGVTAAAPFQVHDVGIAFTSNSFPTGTFRPGSSAASFNGFWYADFSFSLPADATNPSLQFNTLQADDRVVLQLNGIAVGDFFLNNFLENPPLTGRGVMSLPPGPPDHPFMFAGANSGTVSSGFVIGGENILRLVVNNTNDNTLSAPTVGFQFGGDGAYAELTGSVSYDVPEPSSVSLLCGFAFVAVVMKRYWRPNLVR